jgi:hypothetical protein
MKRLASLVVCASLALGTSAAWAEEQTPSVQPAPAPAKVKPVKEKKICKREEEKGSRLGGKTTCMTKAEWDEISFRQRMEIERKIHQGPAPQ